jgi:hypothetical protein
MENELNNAYMQIKIKNITTICNNLDNECKDSLCRSCLHLSIANEH